MKLGGLFSGVGGFELAWTQLGHEVAWMCEWDAKARKVLEARFPGVPIYEDVRDLDPAEVEAVDVLTGGSPCQGFSVAGSRSGLEHSESQLFADYVRIMNGLANRGLQYAVWENVPGVLSITNDDGERTFEHVVAALAGGTEPVRLPTDKRWNTGLAAGRGRAVAWRVLDSRYFGVAQRRRRVFACVAFGDSCEDRAGRALLAVAEGVRGDSSSGVPEGEAVAGGVAGRAGVPSVAGTVSAKWAKGTGGPSGDEVQNLVTDAPQAFNWQQGDAEYSLRDDSSALAADSRPAVMIPQAFRKAARAQSAEDAESWVEDGQANTLNVFDVGDTRTKHAIVEQTYSLQGSMEGRSDTAGPGGKGWKEDESFTLNTADRHSVVAPSHAIVGPQSFDEMNFTTDGDAHHVLRAGTKQSTGVVVPQAFRKSKRAQSDTDDETWVADGGENTLNVFDVGDTRTTHAIVEATPIQDTREVHKKQNGLGVGQPGDPSFTLDTTSRAGFGAAYGVRRLTPVECERLQSFPDGWTEPSGSDSARYKAMGNAVTVNVVRWILGRLP